MKEWDQESENGIATFGVTCPYCGYNVFPMILSGIEEKDRLRHYIVACSGNNCKKHFFVTREKEYGSRLSENIKTHVLPMELSEAHRIKEEVPYDIRKDYAEASNCYKIEAYKACVSMCRRTLQNALVDKGANKKKKLIDQIEEIITDKQLKDIAHSTRIIGNWGSHEQDDDLKDVDWKKASAILQFTWSILDYLYIQPLKLKKLKDSMSGKENNV